MTSSLHASPAASRPVAHALEPHPACTVPLLHHRPQQSSLEARRASSLAASSSGRTIGSYSNRSSRKSVLCNASYPSSTASSSSSSVEGNGNGAGASTGSNGSSNTAESARGTAQQGQGFSRRKQYDVVALSNLCVDVVVKVGGSLAAALKSFPCGSLAWALRRHV
jgi:hypothetical protein